MKKNKILLLSILSLLVSWGSTAFSQTINIQYAAPTDTMTHYFNVGDIFNRQETLSDGTTALILPHYRWVRLTGAAAATFRSMAPDSLLKTYDSLIQNSALKRRVDRIMRLSGGVVNVTVYLIDDRTGLDAASRIVTQTDNSTHQLYAWPAANNYLWQNNYYGYTYLGERASRLFAGGAGGWKNWEGTVLHEISHTQFLPDPVYGRNKWGAARGVEISYGGDKSHYIVELLADPQMPLDEGLGTFWGTEHNSPAGATRLRNFLNDTTSRFWLGSRSFLTSIPEMWNAPHEVEWSGPANNIPPQYLGLNTRLTTTDGNYEIRKYKWHDIPGKFVMYNEQMATSMLYLYWQHAFSQIDTAFNYLYSAAGHMALPNVHNRYPAFLANHLAFSMEAYAGTATGQAEKTAGTLRSSMFAYALLDIFEHFGRTEDDLKREFTINKVNNQLPLASNVYWNHRNALRTRVAPHISRDHIDMEAAIREARDYFTQANTILP